jgi:hypothetical protein
MDKMEVDDGGGVELMSNHWVDRPPSRRRGATTTGAASSSSTSSIPATSIFARDDDDATGLDSDQEIMIKRPHNDNNDDIHSSDDIESLSAASHEGKLSPTLFAAVHYHSVTFPPTPYYFIAIPISHLLVLI